MGLHNTYRVILLLGLLFPAVLGAGDKRKSPLELFLIIDGSSALKKVQAAVVRWLHEEVVDSILQEGDRLTIWLADETGQEIFSGALRGAGDKARIKRVLQSVPFEGGTANFAGPIRDATARIQRSHAMVYTLLITGSTAGRSPSLGGDAVGLLRFTRVEEFSGWRAMVIGLGLSARVQQAAAAYMQKAR